MAAAESGDDQHDVSPERLLLRARQRVQRVRQHYWQERFRGDGSVSQQTVERLATVAMLYRDALMDYRDEQTLRPPWDERNLDWITRYVDETVEVRKPSSGRGGADERIQRPAITQVDHRRLYKLTKALDKVWRDLGLGADVGTDERPLGKIPYDGDGGDDE